ncbi:MAG: hypothetical protein H0W73_03620 [Bacteroidetes bacterium]|nr:hypothetical protein [Bacteroidota bacterium]
MIVRSVFFFILAFLPALAFSQSPEEEIDPENINAQYLEHLIKQKVDSVRHSKGLLELVNDSILYVASSHHSNNMAKTRNLSHFEASKKFKNPQKRAEAFGAVNYFTGENVAFITAYKKLNIKHPELSEFFTYGEFASRMVKNWVKSRGHYRNIIKKEYQITGVTISYDKKTKRIYGTQKFAEVKSKFVFIENTNLFPYEDENEIEYELKELKQVSRLPHKGPHRWRLKRRKKFRRCKECDGIPSQKNNLFFYVDSSMNVHCYTKDGTLFKRLTKRRRDGFALEIIKYDDYVCSNKNFFLKPSRRNGECIANGTIQKPVYKWKLRKIYRKIKRVWKIKKWRKIFKVYFTFKFRKYGDAVASMFKRFPGTPSDNIIGKLPLYPKDYYECNIMFLKKRRVCQILNFTDYCGEYFNDIHPTPLLPELSNVEYQYPEDTVHYSFSIYFKQGKSDYNYNEIKPLLDTIKLENYSIVKLDINATASVEGDAEINNKLTFKRALSIRKVLDSTRVDTLIKDIQAKEDWDHFNKNISKTKYKYLTKLSKEEIKKELQKQETAKDLESILNEERKANVKLWLMSKVTDSLKLQFALKRYEELIQKAHLGKLNGYDAIKLHSIQTLMYKQAIKGKLPYSKLTELIPPNEPMYSRVYLNYVIFKRETDTINSKDIYERELYEALKTVAITAKASQTQRYNFLTILVNHWDSLSWYDNETEKAQPKKIFGLLGRLNNSVIPKDTLDILKMNFNFKAANWFFSVDPDDNSQLRAMNNIYYYYKGKKNTDSTAYKIAKYFIFYNHDDYAYRILAPFAIRKEPNHEVFSLYIKMAYLRDMYRQRSRVYKLMKTAPNILTKDEYCNLFTGPCNISMQIFDHEEIRQTWCKTCADHKNFAQLYREMLRLQKE